jgi:hypothetical protein
MILKIFSLKIFSKKLAFFAQNKTKLCKNWIITLDFEKNANFLAENWQKSQKIVIITSTPGRPDWANFRPLIWTKMGWSIFSQTHQVTLNTTESVLNVK